MESKFVILVVFAALTPSSFALPSTAYGLSEEKTAILNRITQNQEAAAAAHFAAVNAIFDIIDKLRAIREYDLKFKNDDLSSVLAKSLRAAKEGINHTLDAIPLITGRNCSAVETARTAVHAHLENVYTVVATAIELASSGNCSEHRAEIANISVASQQSLENEISNVYAAIRTCLNTTDADELAAINAAEIGSSNGIRCANTAVFNAIRVYGAGISVRDKDLAVISDTKVTRKQALAGMRTVVETSFSPVKSLYINSQLGQTGVASSLLASQYAQMVVSTKDKEAVALIFNIIEGYMQRVRLGLSDACNNDLTKIDAAQAETATNFKDALRVLVDSVATIEPIPSSATLAIREYFDTFSENAAASYYSGLKYALGQETNYTEALRKIEALRIELQATFPNFVQTNYYLVQKGRSGRNDIDAGITALRDASFVQARNFVDYIYRGIFTLAKACYGIEAVSENDFATIQSAQNGIGSLVADFTSNIATADVTLIQANAVNQVITTPTPSHVVPNNLLNIGVGVGIGNGIGLSLGLNL